MTPIALIIHDIRSTYNVGSIMRSADCFGVNKIYFSGYTPYPAYKNDNRLAHIAQKLTAQIAKTALGADKTVPFTVYTTVGAAIEAARQDGYTIALLEQDSVSIPLATYVFTGPTAIVLGNEVLGADTWTKRAADVILEITQYGTKESLNVASAAAIALFAARLKT